MFQPVKRSLAVILTTALAIAATANASEVVITVEHSKEAPAATSKPFHGQRPSVDVAVLLDTSNSMDGLIGQAKSQLWTIVQQFAKAQKNGQTPVLRVALFEYGNTRLPASEGYIRQVVPLADNLDKLSEALFALSTQGGDEYCGKVIDEAITRLAWSTEPGAYKAIFIAGNEPFTQGPVDYQKSCKRAIEQGIVINTIHCGGNQAGINGKWRHGAQLAEGEFFNIDQDRVLVHIPCPQDKIIIRLNAELNKTYLWYGDRKERFSYRENQAVQDANAAKLGAGVAASRSITKAGKAYGNLSRDLVDTLEADEEIMEKVESDDLPELLQKMRPEERKAYVKKTAAKRAELQKKIKQLATQREAYLAKERQRRAEVEGGATLGDAVVAAIQKQLRKSGFQNAVQGE